MSGPRVTSGKDSEQIVGTPPEFVAAIERRFGPIAWDLAALASNRVRQVPWYGPGSPHGENALDPLTCWHADLNGGLGFLNPGFANAGKWAERCASESRCGARVALLTPLSSDNWARDFVHGHAQVEGLNPRVKFVGHKTAFPKCLMLSMYGPGFAIGFEIWRWKP